MITYFKTTSQRYAGKKSVMRYLKVIKDREILTVDVTNNTIKTLLTTGSQPHDLMESNEEEFNQAYNKVKYCYIQIPFGINDPNGLQELIDETEKI